MKFVLRHDKGERFLFASLQSDAGVMALEELKRQNDHLPDSLVLFYKGRYYLQSGAALYIGYLLGGIWTVSIAGFIIPRFIRDAVYKWIARNRYKWFGRRESCMMPDEQLKNRFIG